MISSLMATVLLIGAQPALAQFVANEVNLCEMGRCTQDMLAVQGAFSSGTEFNPILSGPTSFYSGRCFHLMKGFDPNEAQHGGFAFWRDQDNALSFNGIFHFFAGKNPYEGMTSGEAFELVRSKGSRAHPVREEPTMGHVILTSGHARIDYWMRTADQGATMTLLSKWQFPDSENGIFCELKRH